MPNSAVPKPTLTDSEIRDLIREAQNGDQEAREKVFMAYLPLAKSYAQKYEGYGVPSEDLAQEAYYGLLVSIDHYDADRKETFATLAVHYINKHIRDNALQKQNVTLPSCYNRDFYYEVKSYIAVREKFIQDEGREPSDQDMSELLNISLFRIRRLKAASEAFLAPSQEYDFTNYHEDVSSRPVEDEIFAGENYFDTDGLVMTLTDREKEVLERRCGFTESQEPQTWPKISAEMGISMETARSAYCSGISKFRRALGVTI